MTPSYLLICKMLMTRRLCHICHLENDVHLCSDVKEISNDVACLSCIFFNRKINTCSRNYGL